MPADDPLSQRYAYWPPKQVRRAVYEAASQEPFALHPVLDLYVDVRELAGGCLGAAGDPPA